MDETSTIAALSQASDCTPGGWDRACERVAAQLLEAGAQPTFMARTADFDTNAYLICFGRQPELLPVNLLARILAGRMLHDLPGVGTVLRAGFSEWWVSWMSPRVLRAPGSMLRAAELAVWVGHRYVRRFPGRLCKGWLAGRYLNPYLRDHPRKQVTDSRFGARFIVDSRDLIQRYIGLFGVWEPHLTAWLERRLRAGDVFVDVGANVGYFAVLGSRLVSPAGAVVAVEASPVLHGMLTRNLELNGCRNVRTVNAAASDAHGELTFVLASTSNMGATSMVPYHGPAESEFTIAACSLAELLSPEEIAATRVIKIDAEGAEGRVVRGLTPVLGRLREDVEIAVEVEPGRMRQLGDDADELLTTMREHGFHAYRLPVDYRPQSYPRALARPRPPRRWSGAIDGETELVFSRVDAKTLSEERT